MPTNRRSLESLKNEAKRWLHLLEANEPAAYARFNAAIGDPTRAHNTVENPTAGKSTRARTTVENPTGGESTRARTTVENPKAGKSTRAHNALENPTAGNSTAGNSASGTRSLTPTLRDVQHALARENGFAGWTELKIALSPSAEKAAQTIESYDEKARALLEAYQTGTPQAMERHHALTWHRRAWPAMRTYVQLDLGKRPVDGSDDVEITIDDARYLIAIEHGFKNWNELCAFAMKSPSSVAMTERPVGIRHSSSDDSAFIITSRDWHVILRSLRENPDAVLDAHGCMTDDILEQVSRIEHVTELKLGNSKALTDVGIRRLARLPHLRRLDLSSTAITDAGLNVLRDLPNLESLSLAMTQVTDAGLANVSQCKQLQRLNVMWTRTGDGAIRALAGHEQLTHFWSGNDVTDAGIAMLHDLPVFKTWRGGAQTIDLLSPDAEPNSLTLRGRFTDDGLNAMRGLDGLFALNLDDSALSITARSHDSARIVAKPWQTLSRREG